MDLLTLHSLIDPSTPPPALLADGILYAARIVGTVVSLSFVVFVARIAKDWGEQGRIVRDTAEKVHETANAISHPKDGLIARIARQEFILTGDKGENGVRGDVRLARDEIQEVKDTLHKQNTEAQARLGNWGLWRIQKDEADAAVHKRLGNIEQRIAASPRRKKARPGEPARRKEDRT